ncbi:MAG: Rrf2 family transcriptional regulator [Rhodothermales bacterium]|nr:Rrf2 family transcriptional regulator [Rhodothermales bacterium]
MLSRACHIAIRATVYLALHSGASYVNTKEIGRVLGESHHFVAKVLNQLAGAGILHSYRGPNGGVALSKSPDKLYLKDIIAVVDGKGALEGCVLGNAKCSASNPCALHEDWSPIRQQIMDLVENRSLGQIAERIRILSANSEGALTSSDFYLRQKTH